LSLLGFYWGRRLLIIQGVFTYGLFFRLDIVCTSAAIQYSSVSLVEVVKSGIPMLVLIASVLTKQEVFSVFKVMIILVLCIGIFLTSYGEINLDGRGLFLAIAATLSGASRLFLMQILLSNSIGSSPATHGHAKINPLLSLAYFAPISAVFLFFPWVFIEAPRLFRSEFVHEKSWIVFVLLFGVMLAFAINYVELLLVEASNALTLCVSGIIKLIVLIFVSAIIFGYHFTVFNVTGILLALTGVIGYNYVRFRDQFTNNQTTFERVENETEDAFVSDY
jgi:drug/metabolite transporter (DMT)-like permease